MFKWHIASLLGDTFYLPKLLSHTKLKRFAELQTLK